jgi:hypothetical protein
VACRRPAADSQHSSFVPVCCVAMQLACTATAHGSERTQATL